VDHIEEQVELLDWLFDGGQEGHDRDDQGKIGEPRRVGVMNGVTALSIRKMASAASAMRCTSAGRALEVPSPA
jgi:hypothetical protein